MTVWSIWNQRNQIRLRQPSCNTDHLARAAQDRYAEFTALQPPFRQRTQQQRVTWHPPPTNVYKINYDGVVFAKENKLGIGVVVRDSNGLVIASMAQQLPQAYKAVEIEAMAASRASEFGVEIGIHQAILEGDSTIVVIALAKGDFGAAPYSLFLKEANNFFLFYSKLSHSYKERWQQCCT